jgi:hypothetical protein
MSTFKKNCLNIFSRNKLGSKELVRDGFVPAHTEYLEIYSDMCRRREISEESKKIVFFKSNSLETADNHLELIICLDKESFVVQEELYKNNSFERGFIYYRGEDKKAAQEIAEQVLINRKEAGHHLPLVKLPDF